VSLVKNLGLDGLDIDWEYPKDSNEAQNLVLLLKECRSALDAYGASLPTPHYFELTIACPAGPQNYEKMDLKGMDRYLSFFNLMAYDFAGSMSVPLFLEETNSAGNICICTQLTCNRLGCHLRAPSESLLFEEQPCQYAVQHRESC
jgi:hypothetical protein